MDVHVRDSHEVEVAADPRDVQTALLVPNSIDVAVGVWEIIGDDGDLSDGDNGVIERTSKRIRTRMRAKRSKASTSIDAASQGEFSEDQIAKALSLFREFMLYVRPEVQSEHWTIKHVRASSEGIRGWLDYNPDAFVKVGKDGLASANLCGLWTRQALCAASEKPHWERVILTVDSGASDTVIPLSVACNFRSRDLSRLGLNMKLQMVASL